MIYVLDNYDSFTYNLVQRLGEIDATLDIQVERNDQTSVERIAALGPERIIVSPGPGTPDDAGISRDLVRELGSQIPVLGVCLGHQCLGEVFGGRVVRAERLMHGKTSLVHHDGQGLFAGLENPFVATRYHSLIVPADSLPDDVTVCAWTEDDGAPREVMALRHNRFPVHGVQFHPESFLCGEGIQLLENFLKLSGAVAVNSQ